MATIQSDRKHSRSAACIAPAGCGSLSAEFASFTEHLQSSPQQTNETKVDGSSGRPSGAWLARPNTKRIVIGFGMAAGLRWR